MSCAEPTTLTDDQLSTLRRAAAMAHTVGSISLRLSAGLDPIADVVPVGDDRRARTRPMARVVDPCGFRIAVARAWVDHSAGRDVGMIGVAPDQVLDIAWSVTPPGQALGFGSVRAPCAGRMVWAFASLLSTAALSTVMTELDCELDVPSSFTTNGLAARLIRDDLLGATVVHVEADPPSSSMTRVLDEVLRRMVAAIATTELLDGLTRAEH